MKLRTFICRLQELNVHLEEFSLENTGQESAPLPTDEIIDIIYLSIPFMWKKNKIGNCSNYANSTVEEMIYFFETIVANFESKEIEKNPLFLPRKGQRNKGSKRKQNEMTLTPVLQSLERNIL